MEQGSWYVEPQERSETKSGTMQVHAQHTHTPQHTPQWSACDPSPSPLQNCDDPLPCPRYSACLHGASLGALSS